MHGALARDLNKLFAKGSVDVSFDADQALEPVDLARSTLDGITAVRAVINGDFPVIDTHGQPAERQVFVLGVDAQRHGRTRTERNRQIVIGAWAAVEAANRCGFVCEKMMRTDGYCVLKLPRTRLRNEDAVAGRVQPFLHGGKIARCPSRNDFGNIGGVPAIEQEMICIIQRYKAFRMLRRSEDGRGMLDSDNLVGGSVHHQQSFAQAPNTILERLSFRIVDKLLGDRKFAPGQCDLRLAVSFDIPEVRMEVSKHMGDVRRGGNGHHRLRLGNATGGGEDSSTAKRVANEKRRGCEMLAHMVGSTHKVLDVRREVGVLKLSL